MSSLTVQSQSVQESPFDSIRRIDGDGEYWLARELMPLLGYEKWERFADVIERAKASCQNGGMPYREHFFPEVGKSNGRPKVDFRLTRYACYLTAQNGDPRKPEVALAQSYFAVKTREAETVIPVQNDRLRELELEVKLLELKGSLVTMHGKETALLLMGHGDKIVESDRPILEVIDQRTGSHFTGQTCKQVAEYVYQRMGKKIKSGAEVERILRKVGRDDLIEYVQRPARQACVPKNKLGQVYEILCSGDRQKLIGE